MTTCSKAEIDTLIDEFGNCRVAECVTAAADIASESDESDDDIGDSSELAEYGQAERLKELREYRMFCLHADNRNLSYYYSPEYFIDKFRYYDLPLHEARDAYLYFQALKQICPLNTYEVLSAFAIYYTLESYGWRRYFGSTDMFPKNSECYRLFVRRLIVRMMKVSMYKMDKIEFYLNSHYNVNMHIIHPYYKCYKNGTCLNDKEKSHRCCQIIRKLRVFRKYDQKEED